MSFAERPEPFEPTQPTRPFEAARVPLSDEARAWIAGDRRARHCLSPAFSELALPVKE